MRNSRLVPRFALVALLSLGVLAGCSTPGFSGNRALLDFLRDGTITRAQVVEQLGEPSAQLRADRILTYRIVGSESEGYALWAPHAPWPEARHSLVLVFDEQGVLQRHALVKIR